ncbi:MAG: hypothetical protein R3327_00940 [Nitrosopumilaceae archaeon]|nr:hypothetical protein [Nitrosopumilaceae archaeon]
MLEYLVLFFIIPFAFAQEVPDYDKPYAPIFFDKPQYSWTDKVKITIVAPSWNADTDLIDSIGGDNDNPIKISTRSHSLEPYRLTETDTSSGVFAGEIILTGFSHDATGDGDVDTTPRTFGNGPTSGFIQTERKSAITVSFEFADGVVLSESAPISWNIGTISFLKDVYLTNQGATIRIIDPDLNLNPEALDQIPVQIASDSDEAGILASAVESREDSGEFLVTIEFTQNSASSGNRLFAIPGDTIYAKYEDHTLPEPFSISDHQEINAMAKLESSTPSTKLIDNNEIIISDSSGNPLTSYSSKNQIQIVGKISNQQSYNQPFVYFFQIKDSNGTVVSISWITGEISPHQTLDVSQSWLPTSSDDYTIETFVWKSIVDPTPLSPPKSKSIFVE